MKTRSTTSLAFLGLAAVLACLPVSARAQDNDQTPKPAGSALPPFADLTNDETPTPDTILPDTSPLTGVQNSTLGRIASPHSYWVPGFQYSNTVQSTVPGSKNNGWTTTNYVAASVNLLESWRSSQLAVNYSGGGDFSTDKNIGNGYFQQLGFSQSFQWARWQLAFLDQFSYLPESQFGFGAGTGLGLPGGGVSSGIPQPGLGGSNFQSLFDSAGPRYSNNITTQAVYQLSPRTSVNVSGSYGILRYVDTKGVASNDAGANVGYNYQLNRSDTIGVVYHFTRFSYVGASQSINDHVINLAYGKKITGKVALRLYGGPDITTFSPALGGVTRQISGSGGGSLIYALNRGSVSVGFNHAVTAGSGVFAGSKTDEINGGISRKLTRAWQGQASIGYGRNRALVNSASQTAYNSVSLAAGVSRPLGPTMNFALAYSAQIQTAGAATGCVGSGCSNDYTQHQITLNFQWHPRELVLH